MLTHIPKFDYAPPSNMIVCLSIRATYRTATSCSVGVIFLCPRWNVWVLHWCGPAQKHQQGPITCSKWSNDSVQDKGIERGIECIGFECFNQVRIESSIRVSRGDPSTSYPCVRGVQHNLIWAMRWGEQRRQKNPSTTWVATFSFCF